MTSRASKSTGSIIIIVFLVLIVIGKRCFWDNHNSTSNTDQIRATLLSHKLSYTKHAKCRMECRDISTDEVLRVLETGTINPSKSEGNQGQCPSFAFEGKTIDGQEVRIIFGKCPKTTRVITCIDLKQEHECNCP